MINKWFWCKQNHIWNDVGLDYKGILVKCMWIVVLEWKGNVIRIVLSGKTWIIE